MARKCVAGALFGAAQIAAGSVPFAAAGVGVQQGVQEIREGRDDPGKRPPDQTPNEPTSPR